LATEPAHYISFPEAVLLHIELMQWYGEIRYGVAFRELVESALARPQQAAAYENADLIRQAATLCFGLVKNHPWVGGNKRTATYITEAFLLANDWQLKASVAETLELVLAIESDLYKVDEIEAWFRLHTVQEEFDSE
jgi:death-on-curing protein